MSSPLLPDDPRVWYRLSDREQSVHDELVRSDAPLAGLFFMGLQLASQADQPGVAYMLAHCGRELCKGVIHLVGGTRATPRTATSSPEDEEAFARIVSKALGGVGRETAVVREWADLQRFFNEDSHLRPDAPDGPLVGVRFKRLTELVFGVIAPYFTIHQDLKSILATPEPTEADEARLRTILSRPTLRRRFFLSFDKPAWLPLLRQMGVFDTPPTREIFEDGGWTAPEWSEGFYLARVASAKPVEVTQILLGVPDSNDNPAVWDRVAAAAVELPTYAPQLTKKIAKGLRSVPSILFSDSIRLLSRRGAEAKDAGAFDLLDSLLAITNDGGEDRIRFTRLDHHTAQKILTEDLDAYLESDAPRLLRCLVAKLYRALRNDREDDSEGRLDTSKYWVRHLDDSSDVSNDPRFTLAVATARAAAVAMSTSEETAQETWRILSLAKSKAAQDIVTRIRLFALARAAPHLVQKVDELLMSPKVLTWDLPSKEVGDVLRRRFEEASGAAKSLFRRTLARGPENDELQYYLEKSSGSDEDSSGEITDSELETALERWQRRQLIRFGKDLPESLADIASKLGVQAAEASARDLALVEDGSWSDGAHWVEHKSPVAATALLALTPAEAADLIKQPLPEDASFDAPDARGLARELRSAVNTDMKWAAELIGHVIVDVSFSPLMITAILEGFIDRLRVTQSSAETPEATLADVDWEAVVTLADHVLKRVSTDEDTREGESSSPNAMLLRAALSVVSNLGSLHLEESAAETVWAMLERARNLKATWRSNESSHITNTDTLLIAALNMASGEVVRATIEFGLAQGREELKRTGEKRLAPDSRIVAHVSKAMQEIVALARSNASDSGLAALGMIGQYVPHLQFLAEDWLEKNVEALFDGSPDPIKSPAWAAYVTRATFYEKMFTLARPYYVKAARAAEPDDKEVGSWSPAESLVVHVMIAVVSGNAVVGDADKLVELTFERASGEYRARAYWNIYRWWEDSKIPINEQRVDRLLAFWDWRLTRLEEDSSEPTGREAEGLLWFLLTNSVPAKDSLPRALRTIALLGNRPTILHSVFERLASTSAEFPELSFEIGERAVHLALASKYPYVPSEPVKVILRAALASADLGIRKRAKHVVDLLGEKTGDHGYGDLLNE